MINVAITIVMAIACGILGRMGGAGKAGNWYDFLLDTKWRDLGCSILITLNVWLWLGFSLSLWWVYLLLVLLHWGAFATYWDWLFKGVDNLWFSGAVAGLALAPIVFINISFLWFVIVRAVILCVVWGCLNKYLPARVFIWRRDVAEENLRYAVSV